MKHPEILVVDDDKDLRETLELDLRRRDFDVASCPDAQAALDLLRTTEICVVLTDIRMTGMDGIEFCRRVTANRPDLPVVVMTAFGSMETAIDAMRAGAYDFVTKPVDFELLAMTLRRAVEHRQLHEQIRKLKEGIRPAVEIDGLLGQSPPMLELKEKVQRLCDVDASILITGESGSGKEVIARALHEMSPRRNGAFVPVNCAAVPEALMESELFGHVKGAFTGAANHRRGLFQEAEAGTLFLDEIGDMPLDLQPKLLRALEQRTIRPVGGDREIPIDVRVIAATNRDLDAAADDGAFRQDLYYRINVIRLDVPPLRARGADILLLAQHFLDVFAERFRRPVTRISDPAARKLMEYDWPGNVRELRNAMERAVALAGHDAILLEDLPDHIAGYQSSHIAIVTDNPLELVDLAELERRYIRHVMKAVDGNRTKAAAILGIDRKTLYRKLQEPENAE